MGLQYIGKKEVKPNSSYSNSTSTVQAVITNAVDVFSERPERKRLLVINRSINTLFVAQGTKDANPASSNNCEIQIPGKYQYEFPQVPTGAINCVWATNSTPDLQPEAYFSEGW